MIVSEWLRGLEPYLVPMAEGDPRQPDYVDRRGYYFVCPHCRENRWLLKGVKEPTLGRTHWRVMVTCSGCGPEPVRIFDANELGWVYQERIFQEIGCACGGQVLALNLTLELYEDRETDQDVSWFNLNSECLKCGAGCEVVDWELD